LSFLFRRATQARPGNFKNWKLKEYKASSIAEGGRNLCKDDPCFK
jgi:hypothetical protein